MKTNQILTILLALGFVSLVCSPSDLVAQPFEIPFYTIAGGGGTSTAGSFELSGTIGQHDAGPTMSGGGFSLTGGFWAVVSGNEGILLGDVNQDGVVNLLDVAPFVNAITTGTFIAEADINQDGFVNLLDVAPFVDLLTGN